MTEQEIRQIVRNEMASSAGSSVQHVLDNSRFGMAQQVPAHFHNGKDSPILTQDNIKQAISISGKVEFAQQAEYTLLLNSSFTPSSIIAYGSITGGGGKFVCVGTASLGPSFYLQPNTTTSVVTNNVQYPFIEPAIGEIVPVQSCAYYGVDGGATPHVLASEGHILNVAYGSPQTIYARVTVTQFTRSFIKFNVETLASGWDIIANIVIT